MHSAIFEIKDGEVTMKIKRGDSESNRNLGVYLETDQNQMCRLLARAFQEGRAEKAREMRSVLQE